MGVGRASGAIDAKHDGNCDNRSWWGHREGKQCPCSGALGSPCSLVAFSIGAHVDREVGVDAIRFGGSGYDGYMILSV